MKIHETVPENASRSARFLFIALCFFFLFSGMAISGEEREVNIPHRGIIIHYDYIQDGRLFGGIMEVAAPGAMYDRTAVSNGRMTWNVKTVVGNGPPENRVDWVIMGDGYIQSEMSTFAVHVQNAYKGWFAADPLDIYASYFNVHQVEVISNQSGIDDRSANPPVYKDTELDMYHKDGVIFVGDFGAAYAAASYAPASDIILAMGHTGLYGGTGADGLAAAASHNYYTVGLVLHEMGHSFGGLADEYYYSGTTYTGGEVNLPNVSIYTAAEQLSLKTKWYRWLDLAHIDSFEGAYYHQYGIYRPTVQSTMNWLENPFYQVNAEYLIFRIYKNVSPIDDATPNDHVLPENTTFFVEPMQPVGHDLDIQWAVDGVDVPGATGKTYLPDYSSLSNDIHDVSVTVTDNTDKVRDEEKRALLMTETREWQTVALDSAGTLEFAEEVCTTNDMLRLRLIDEDLVGMGSYQVTLDNGDNDIELLLLSEVYPASGVFEGTIPTSPWPGVSHDGDLNASVGQILTAVYKDEDDGTGNPALVEDTLLVISSLFDPPVLNDSFESQNLGPSGWDIRIDDWIINANGLVFIEGGALFPTPYGDNDVKMMWGGAIWQQIGTWEEDVDHDVTIWIGRIKSATTMKVSLWAGGDPAKLPVDFGNIGSTVGATMVDEAQLVPTVPVGEGQDMEVTLNTGTGFQSGDAMWIQAMTDDGGYVDMVRIVPRDYAYPPVINSITPDQGLLGGGTTVTIDGSFFCPGAKVFFDSRPADSIQVTSTAITCQAPAAPIPGFVDVTVSTLFGSTMLKDGFEYVPVQGGDPLNLTDIDTSNLNPPQAVNLAVTGMQGAFYMLFISPGGGPTKTPWGNAGLEFPIQLVLAASIPSCGYEIFPLQMENIGPLTFYLHALVDQTTGPCWASGGNNPNGSGSILFVFP